MDDRHYWAQKIKESRDLTSFQKKVLQAVMSIPPGEVRTYAWAASRAGSPGAARAAGSALAKNPFAPHVPCHRVISSDGRVGGYSAAGGAKRKAQMLREEGWTGETVR